MITKNFNLKYLLAALLILPAVVSCDEWLDVLPDSRMELSSVEDVAKLLVNAYPTQSSSYMLEMYCDNVDENINTSWSPYDDLQEQAWNWKDINISDDEAPSELWNAYYGSMAAANVAIEYIESLKDKTGYEMYLGEAYAARAYNAFKLYEAFCMAYDPATANKELGLPYPTEPETTIGVEYTRGTLQEFFEKIDADIQAALPLVGNTYTAPKYHFTKNATLALAARFYLNYRKFDKAIEYASEVLGSTPSALLRDWKAWKALDPNKQVMPEDFVKSDKNCNILLLPIYSQLGVYTGPYGTGLQFRHNHLISTTETMETTGPWGSYATLGYFVWSNSSFPGPFIRTTLYSFEYTDVVAGIGFAHCVIPEFTTDRLLLERAEAYALSGEYDLAVADINSFLTAFKVSGKVTLTKESLKSFYDGIEYYTDEVPTQKKKFNTSLVSEDDVYQEPVLQCVVQLMRLSTLHLGVRMQYVKRYGIEILRRSVDASSKILEIKDRLLVDDPRRAMQLPQDVILGNEKMNPLEANPRN